MNFTDASHLSYLSNSNISADLSIARCVYMHLSLRASACFIFSLGCVVLFNL